MYICIYTCQGSRLLAVNIEVLSFILPFKAMNNTLGGNGTTSSNPDYTNNQFPNAATITMIEVIVIAGFLIILLAVGVSATSCVLVRMRKKRKFDQDESGRRAVRMVPSNSPPPPVRACLTQCGSDHAHPLCHKTTLANEAPSPMTNPQVHVSRENGKVIQSLYVFELEDSCSEDDEYDDIVQRTKEGSYDDVVPPFPPAHTSQLEDLVDMDTLQSKIATLTRSYHYYEDVAVATDQQFQDGTLTDCNGYESLNTASDSDADSVNSQDDEDCYYNVYTKPPTSTGTLVRELQHMSITQTIKANEVQ